MEAPFRHTSAVEFDDSDDFVSIAPSPSSYATRAIQTRGDVAYTFDDHTPPVQIAPPSASSSATRATNPK